MSLYLVGRATDSSLVIAADGRQLALLFGDVTIVDQEEIRKISPLYKDIVLCQTGASLSGDRLQKIADELKKHSLEARIKSSYDILNILAKKYCSDESHPFATGHLFTRYEGKPLVSKISFNSSSISRVDSPSEMTFPYRFQGISKFALDILLENCLGGQEQFDRDYLKGFFIYMLNETEKLEYGVGGKKQIGMIDENGFRFASDYELMQADNLAEQNDLLPALKGRGFPCR